MVRTSRQVCALILMTLLITPESPNASAIDDTGSDICEDASEYAASRVGVPLQIMRALTRTETGRRLDGQFLPWPWTVNMEGEGKWFATMHEALNYAISNYETGARSFDVGCFQVNFKWHGEAFSSIEEMFDPYQNALYAARFLASLYQELGSWTAAAGAYHSRTPELAEKYETRFSDILTRLSADSPPGDGPEFGFAVATVSVGQSSDTLIVPSFAPLVPETNTTGSLFIARESSVSGLLRQANGAILRPIQ